MYDGDNHEAVPMTTVGVLVGIEKENGVDINKLLEHVVEALIKVEGIGRVDAEYIGELDDEKSLEEEVVDAIMNQPPPMKES